MKIGIYSDVHFSLTSSILKSSKQGSKYTEKLEILINSMKWMYDLFSKEKVGMIIDCGDLTDSSLLSSDVSSALSEALSYKPSGVVEYHILGNHEIKDKYGQINSINIIHKDETKVITNFNKVELTGGTYLLMMPYRTDSEEYSALYKEVLDHPENKYYIFTHSLYLSRAVAGYIVATEGIDENKLGINKNVLGIFNGHIHTTMDDGVYHQIGSLSGLSFNDRYNTLPSVLILETDTGKVERISNPEAVLFYTITYDKNLIRNIKNLPNNKKCLRIKISNPNLRDKVVELLSNEVLEEYSILNYIVKVEVSLNKQSEIKNEVKSETNLDKIDKYEDPYLALLDFTKKQETLPYELKDMEEYLNKYYK